MASTFFGLNIANSGLMAQQTAMTVVGHNVANANNPAYKRQQAVMGARSSYPYPSGAADPSVGQLGAGTSVVTIRRMQDGFLDNQLRASSQNLGQWRASQQSLGQIVGIIGEPSDTGLASDLDKFWNAWQTLSLDPENSAARNQILEFGDSVAKSMNRIYSQIENLRGMQDQAIQSKVDSVNGLARELAEVNDEIQRTIGAADAPNDLLDRRDAILGELSQMVDIQVYGNGGASDVITIGGRALVQGNRYSPLATGTDAEGHATVTWADDGEAVDISGGELGGILTVQNENIPQYLKALDDIAGGLARRINELHAAGQGLDGSTGTDFFQGAGARDIRINDALRDNPRKVAASASGASGNGSVAKAIAGVKFEDIVGGTTVGEAYRSFVSKNASDASSAARRLDSQGQMHQQITLQQQSVSGVSLDEEMTDMIRFQQAYNASARLLTTMDEMLSTLIDRLGVVGR